MKICFSCTEENEDDAIKCKHCGKFLDASLYPRVAKEKLPWYFRTSFIILALCSVGPLALPLIWLHPKLAQVWKFALTIGILVLSWYLFKVAMVSLHNLKEAYKESYKLIEGLK